MTYEQSDKVFDHLVNMLGDQSEAVTALCAIWDKVDEILTEFDFKKVYRIMKMMGWCWANWEDEYGNVHTNKIPSEYAIRKEALRLICRALEDGTFISSGGFDVDWSYDEGHLAREDDGSYITYLSLKFVLERWD